MAISESNANPYSPQTVKTFMDILRPVIRISQIVGVCPLEISGHNIQLRLKSLKFLHTLFTLVILSCYFIYSLYQLVCAFGRGRNVPDIVSTATWVAGTLIPIAMLILTVLKRHQFAHFFEKSNEYRVPLRGMIKCEDTLRYARKIFIVYIFLTIGTCFFVALDVIRTPTRDVFVLAYIDNPSPLLVAVSCVFQCYLIILRSCGCAFIEVLCCCIGASFQNTIMSIIDELHDAVGFSSTPIYRKHKSSISQHEKRKQCSPATISPSCEPQLTSIQGNFLCEKNIEGFGEPIYSNLRCLCDKLDHNPQFTSHPWPTSFYGEMNNLNRNDKNSIFFDDACKRRGQPRLCSNPSRNNLSDDMDPNSGAKPIVVAIKKFNCITSMQSLLNCIFGPILALDIGLLVLVSCLLLYLKINYLGSGTVDFYDGVIFIGNCILYFARLVVVFISLGNVHEMSTHFNDCVTTSLMHVKNPRPPEINLVLAHLTSQFANPSCFSAAGFFVFSRGSLLAVLSGIMTYVVFLLQAKM